MTEDRYEADSPEDVLAKQLAEIIVDLKKEWRKEVEIITAESRAVIAEHRLAVDCGKLDALLRRVDEIEKRGVRFCGTYQRAVDYPRGSLSVHDGSLWAATREAAAGEEPGKSSAWQLAAKAGRDAR